MSAGSGFQVQCSQESLEFAGSSVNSHICNGVPDLGTNTVRVTCTFFQVLGTMPIDDMEPLLSHHLLPIGGCRFWPSP
jgi:hypothetical protein